MAGVDHVITRGVVRYPSDADDFGASDVSGDGKYVNTSFNPYILHYGIDFNIGDYNWNKMVYRRFDLSACQVRSLPLPDKK